MPEACFEHDDPIAPKARVCAAERLSHGVVGARLRGHDVEMKKLAIGAG
jgi:hypothetical protein